MANTILDFKNNLLGGGARANQFVVYLSFPSIVANSAGVIQKSQFLCHGASLPGSEIAVAPLFYRGREVKLPGERTFRNWTVRVINDTDFAIRDSFENWMHSINNIFDNSGETDPTRISTQLEVQQLDRNDQPLKAYQMVDAWPVNLGEIELSFDANNRIEEFTVEFAYSYWIPTTF